jgi:hypothetical protein
LLLLLLLLAAAAVLVVVVVVVVVVLLLRRRRRATVQTWLRGGGAKRISLRPWGWTPEEARPPPPSCRPLLQSLLLWAARPA